MASLTITDISVNGSGTILCVKASCPVPASYGGPVDWYPGFLSGKNKSLNSGGKLAFLGAATTVVAGALTWMMYFGIRPENRVTYKQSPVTFSCDLGVVQDSKGNVLAPHAAIAVTNRSYSNASGLLSENIQVTGTAVVVYVNFSSGLDSRTIAQAQVVSTPFKTLKGAMDKLRDNGHQTDGSQVWIVESSVEVRSAVDPYPVLQCGGPSVDHPFLVKPIAADGFSRATQRALFQLTNAYGIVREGGGINPASLNNVVLAGLNFVNQDASVTVNGTPAHVSIGAICSNLCLYEIRSEKSGTGIDLISRSTAITLWRPIAVDAAQPTSDSHGLFSSHVQFPYTCYEASWDRNGYYNSAFTKGDQYSRNMYISNHGDNGSTLFDAAPLGYMGGWNTRSSSSGAQLRNGGAMVGTLHHKNPAGSYVSGMGGRIAFNAFCQTTDQLTLTIGVYDDTCSGPYINSADEGCEGSLLELNIVTPSPATQAVFNQRSIGFGGNGLGKEHVVRNNIAVGNGPAFVHCPIVSNVYIDGKQPQKLTYENNIVDPRASLRLENIFLRIINAAGMAWLSAAGNGFFGSATTQWGYVELTNTYYTQAAFITALGGALSGSDIAPAPAYPDNTADLVSWYTSNGGVGGESGMLSAIRGRTYEVWNAWDDWEAAVKYLQTAWQPSNKAARSSNPLDIEGLPNGLPEWTSAPMAQGGWNRNEAGVWTHTDTSRDVVIAPDDFGQESSIVIQVRRPADDVLAFIWGSGDGRSGFEVGVVGANVIVRKVDFGVVGAALATAAHGLAAGVPYTAEYRVIDDAISVYFNGSTVAALTYTNSGGTYLSFQHWGFVSSIDGATVLGCDLADLVVDPNTGGEVVVVVASGSIYYSLDTVNYTLIRANELKRSGPVSLDSFEQTVYAVDGANGRKIDMDTFLVTKWGGTTAVTALPGATESSPGVFVAGSTTATHVFTHIGRIGLIIQNALYFSAIGDGDDYNFAALDQPGRAWGTPADLPGKIGRPIRGVLSSSKGILIIGTDDGYYRLYGDYSLDGIPDLSPIYRGTGISGPEAIALASEGRAVSHSPNGFMVLPESGGAYNLTQNYLTDAVQIPAGDVPNYLVQVRRETSRAKTWAFLTPTTDGARTQAICYEERVGKFNPEGYGCFTMDLPSWVGPTASCVARGKLLLGTRNGRIVTFDDAAGDDCGESVPMTFSVKLDDGDSTDDTVLQETSVVLGRGSGDVLVNVYGGVSAEDAMNGDRRLHFGFTARASEPGMPDHTWARDPAIVADFSHSAVGERVAVESIAVYTVYEAPTHRVAYAAAAVPPAPCSSPPDDVVIPDEPPPFDGGPGAAAFNAIPDAQQREPERIDFQSQFTAFFDTGGNTNGHTLDTSTGGAIASP